MYKTLAVSSTQGDVGKADMKDFMVAGTTNTGTSKGTVEEVTFNRSRCGILS